MERLGWILVSFLLPLFVSGLVFAFADVNHNGIDDALDRDALQIEISQAQDQLFELNRRLAATIAGKEAFFQQYVGLMASADNYLAQANQLDADYQLSLSQGATKKQLKKILKSRNAALKQRNKALKSAAKLAKKRRLPPDAFSLQQQIATLEALVSTKSAELAAIPIPPAFPTITTQPQSQAVNDGSSASFSVIASGMSPLTYQWSRNGFPIPGETRETLTLPGVSLMDNQAVYSVLVSNAAGAVVSAYAMLSVAPIAPSIFLGPQSQTVLEGSSATFSVSAIGSAPLSFQWFRNGVHISGATHASYVLPVSSLADSGSTFYAVVSNPSGVESTPVATLSVTQVVQAPIFLNQPQSVTVNINESTSFSVVVSGTQPITFQWFRNGAPIPGATSSSYAIGSAGLNDSGDLYSVVATNSAGSVSSSTAALTAINPGQISLFAGELGGPGNIDGHTSTARFWNPSHIAVDAADNVYVTEAQSWLFGGSRLIRRISPAGMVTTIPASRTHSWDMNGIVVDSSGVINVSDSISGAVVRILVNGSVEYLRPFMLTVPGPLTIDSNDNLMVVNQGYGGIVKIYPNGSAVRIGNCCGYVDGLPMVARFAQYMTGITADASGNTYLSDPTNNAIRQIRNDDSVSTAASPVTTGPLTRDPHGSFFTAVGQSIMKFTLGETPTVIANVGSAYVDSSDLVSDSAGNIFVADRINHVVSKVSPSGDVSVFAGKTSQKPIDSWQGITKDSSENLYVMDGHIGEIKKISHSGTVTHLTLSADFRYASRVAMHPDGSIYAIDSYENLWRINPVTGSTNKLFLLNGIPSYGLAINDSGVIYTTSSNSVLRHLSDGTSLGPIGSSDFAYPRGLACDTAGNIYVADTGNHVIKKIAPDGSTTTVAGIIGQSGSNNGQASMATFSHPWSLVVDSSSNVYVADSGNAAIRKISSQGVVSTLAGSIGSKGVKLGNLPGSLSRPLGITLSSDESKMYLTDENSVLVINLQ